MHRGTDPTADYQDRDVAAALRLDDFDELWIYSINAGPPLTPSELKAAKAFMDGHKGGVLITGDHADLGMAFSNLPRVARVAGA